MDAGQSATDGTNDARSARFALPVLLLTLHALLASAALSLSPRGFGWSAGRTVVHLVLPVGCLALVGVALLRAYLRRNAEPLADALLGLAGMWLGAGVANRAVFPITGPWSISAAAIGLAATLAALAARSFRRLRWTKLALAAAGAGLGGLVIALLRAPDPDTHPLGLEPSASVHDDSPLRVACGPLRLTLSPFLTFGSGSRDRYWSLFDPERPEQPSYALEQEEPLSFTAFSTLARPVFAHHSSFTTLKVEQGAALSLSFAGDQGDPFEVRPADYPGGRPLRFAYLDEAGVLHVVEATDGEKGPYHTLGEHRLGRRGALQLGVFDRGVHACTVELEDWASQASTQASPTAGWGVPVNVISFHTGAEPGTATITLSLAATGIGRGFDTVGHAAGVYRNRVRVLSAAREPR